MKSCFFALAFLFYLPLYSQAADVSKTEKHIGNYRRGRALFAQRGCAACHAVDGKTVSLGPDLTKPEKPLTRQEFLESINEPSKQIKKGFEAYSIILESGKVLTGRITKQTDDAVTVLIPDNQLVKEQTIPRDEIEEMIKQSVSVMPKGLLKGVPESQVSDLLAYLASVGDPRFTTPPSATIPTKLSGVMLEPEAADSTVYSPEESMKRIHVAPGYRLELVAAEPMIEEPVLCVWDGNGRMYVAEMRTYMQDADGIEQDLPKSRVSLLEDTDGDGRMDKVTRFIDNMVLPRMILPFDDRIIVNETYTEDYYSYRDTNGDGVADEKILLYPGGKAGGNLEHQNSALTWGLDNWIYSARQGTRRHRYRNGKWESERIYGDNGQWGLAMDDVGRFFLSAAGGEKPAYGFQQLPQYGRMQLSGGLEPNFEAVYPIVKMVDVQGGLGRVDKERGGLNRFTGCAGQSIFRGDQLPDDFYGDYILPEPVGRLVRRAKVTQIDGKRVLSNAYENSEFIASTDKNFRPLWSATGPDGCLYIVDMYRGIIQEGNWTKKGSYLRDVIDKEGFAKNIGRGRIYRVVHDSTARQASPKLLDLSTAQLVKELSHPNGWRRDTAQKLIVLRNDKSVVPTLEQLAQAGDSPLGRMHALWTLDGLGMISKPMILAGLCDADPRVKQAGMRLSEPLLADDFDLVKQVAEAGYDDDISVVVQAVNSLRYAKSELGRQLISEFAAAYAENDLVLVSSQASLRYREGGNQPVFANLDAKTLEQMKQGYQTYTLLCIRCHGHDGKGAFSSDGLQLAPSLANSPRLLDNPELPARILLHGLSGPIEGKKYPGLMESMKRQDDAWIASALTYVRNSFGNSTFPVTVEDVARVRSMTHDRIQPYTIEELSEFLPISLDVMKTWKLSASHGWEHVRAVIGGKPHTRYSTNESMNPGMWFLLDMRKPYHLTSILLDTQKSRGDYPRGYAVSISDDGKTWSPPIIEGKATTAITDLSFPQGVSARFVKIEQTGQHGLFWSIHELKVYGKPAE